MTEQLVMRGTLVGHSGWVTSLATSLEKYEHLQVRRRTEARTDISTARICSFLEVATSPSSSGILPGTSRTMDTQNGAYTATLTSSPIAYAKISIDICSRH